MRIVDFATFPDGEDEREALRGAFDGIYIEDGEVTEPTDASAVIGLALPAELSDDELRARADLVRKRIVHVLGDEATDVRFQISGGPGETAGGAPDHLE